MSLRSLKTTLALAVLATLPGFADPVEPVISVPSASSAADSKAGLCAVTVMYVRGRGQMVQIHLSDHPCDREEVALAHALAALLAAACSSSGGRANR